MKVRTPKSQPIAKRPDTVSALSHHFRLFSVVSVIIISLVAWLGLRHILQDIVVREAEKDAICVSTVARDCEIHKYVETHQSKNGQFFTIPPAELPDVEREMSVFVKTFDLVKIKIYNVEPRVIYSTDPGIIGRLDPHNKSLLIALAGKTVSHYQPNDKVWDLADEERVGVDIVETYVPIYGHGGKIIGSFEIYKDITHNLAIADTILFRSWSVLAVTVLGVFAILMLIIHRAVNMIEVSTINLISTNEQLQQEIEDRKRLENELLSIIERERQRIGQELHDSIGQQLAGIAFMVEKLGKRLSRKSLTEEMPYAERIGTCVSQMAKQTRHLAKGLHPVDLDRHGLVSAMEELAANTEQLFSISCVLQSERSFPVSEVSIAINLYRIAQEAITNAVKHGNARNIRIELTSMDGLLKLTVENDGLEYSPRQTHGEGMGLRIMHYRAEAMNGSLEICKGAKGGATVTCALPNGNHPK